MMQVVFEISIVFKYFTLDLSVSLLHGFLHYLTHYLFSFDEEKPGCRGVAHNLQTLLFNQSVPLKELSRSDHLQFC